MSPRKVYRHSDLERVLAPKSVAIVGVSTNAAGFGARTLQNMKLGGFKGAIYPINAKYEQIGELRCYPSITALPESPDCVIVAVPREAVEAVVRECAERKAGGMVILTSGFAETAKAEHVALQARIVEAAQRADMRVIGPNCIGIMNHSLGMLGTFSETPFEGPPRHGAIGLVSQSGALGNALGESLQHGVPFSFILTSGNACDVDVADQIAYLADDPATQVIACLFEGMAHPQRLLQAAELCLQNGKPVVVYKMATGERGAKAAMSHTGSLAGSNAAYRAAFERAGVVMVDRYEALIETASFFAKAPPPKARGVAVVATSGGACIMAADHAELHGVDLPAPTSKTLETLERLVPEFGAVGNPCDVTAQVLSSPEALYACTDALLSDPAYGTLVVPHPTATKPAVARIQAFSDAAKRYGKIACNVWITQHLEGPGARESQLDPHIALFRSLDRCFTTLSRWHWRDDWMKAQPRRYTRLADASAQDKAARLIDAARNKTLTERESKDVLAAYGVPVVGEKLVQSADEAVAAAKSLGLPVVMKVESPDLPHKTEAGVIRLNLKSEAEVKAAYDAVMGNANKVSPKPRINGVLVQPMVPAGTEIMVGARIDPLFGPLIVVGLGGILVELLKDSSVELAPVTKDEAAAMLQRLKGRKLIEGFRGSEPVDEMKLAEVIVRLSEFAADQKERIAELDVNPLICAGSRIVAVDALIVKRGQTTVS
jgi:acyl-CoA synthetase (NDP forming)